MHVSVRKVENSWPIISARWGDLLMKARGREKKSLGQPHSCSFLSCMSRPDVIHPHWLPVLSGLLRLLPASWPSDWVIYHIVSLIETRKSTYHRSHRVRKCETKRNKSTFPWTGERGREGDRVKQINTYSTGLLFIADKSHTHTNVSCTWTVDRGRQKEREREREKEEGKRKETITSQ